jgi:hypothetical protein
MARVRGLLDAEAGRFEALLDGATPAAGAAEGVRAAAAAVGA